MVYCGKPSKSCAECRSRRTKCDMLRPSCSQCIRARRVCRGYRDPGDLMFRDESKGLIAKARRRGKSSQHPTPASDGATSRETSPRSVGAHSTDLGSVPSGLAISLEDQATTYFFQNYVPARNELPGGSFQYLQDMYHKEKIGRTVADLVISVGIAGLSNFWKAPKFMVKANMKYTSALRLLSSHLRNVNEAKADQTFAAVMLLGLYEISACNRRTAMDAWTKHTLASSALMQLRGKKQLRAKMGRELFLHYRSQVISNCLQSNSCAPSFIREWNKALDPKDPLEIASNSVAEMYLDYADLRGAPGPADDFSSPEDTICRCLALDAQCQRWVQSCPLQYAYQTINVKTQTPEVFRNQYHVYSSLWIAMTWNHFRALRILIHDLLLTHLKHFYQTRPGEMLYDDPTFFHNQKSESENIILRSSTDICSSVPYFLGSQPDSGATHIPRAFNCNLLLWPLYNAGCTEVIPNHQRDWVIDRLRYISEVMLIGQATPLIHVLAAKATTGAWDDSRCRPCENNVLDTAGPAVMQKNACLTDPDSLYVIHDSLVLRSQSQKYEDPTYSTRLEQVSTYSNPMQEQPTYQQSAYQDRAYDFSSNLIDHNVASQTSGMLMAGNF